MAIVFDWVLKRIGASGLLRGKTIGIDATTLFRRDSEQGYEESLAKASGRPDGKIWPNWTASARGKGSNRVWKHPHDADARITRMKDGRTHLAHKAGRSMQWIWRPERLSR